MTQDGPVAVASRGGPRVTRRRAPRRRTRVRGAPQRLTLRGRRVLLAALAGAVLALATGPGVLDSLRADPPAELVPLFVAASRSHPLISPERLAAHAKAESDFDADAVSPAGAQGMMQFMPATWGEWGVDGNGDGVADPFDPADAIPAAAAYLDALHGMVAAVPGDTDDLVSAAYNAGPNRVVRANGVPSIEETQDYVERVARYEQRYAGLGV